MATTTKLRKKAVGGRELAVIEGTTSKIGNIIMFSIGACEIPWPNVTEYWEDQTVLSERERPSKPTPFEAFQNTCSETNIKIWQRLDQDRLKQFEEMFKAKGQKVEVEYLSLPAPGDKWEYILERRIWVSTTVTPEAPKPKKGKKKDGEAKVDEQGNAMTEVTPEHPNIARLIFDAPNDRILVRMFPDFDSKEFQQEIETLANEEYRRQKELVNGTRVRQALYRVIEGEDGVHLLGGSNSTWFIPTSGEAKLEQFNDFLETVVAKFKNTAYPVEFYIIEVADNQRLRANIARDVQREVSDKWMAFMNDLDAWVQKSVKSDKMTPEKIESAVEEKLREAEKLGLTRDKYEKMLGLKVKVERGKTLNIPTEKMTGRTEAVLRQIAGMAK